MWEKTGLKPYDTQKDQNDWPQLELTNVMVKSKAAGKKFEDLLNVMDDGPFEVRGTLSRIPRRLHGIIRTNTVYNTPLVLSNVYTYSIEKLKNGNIKIWALGACAWYSILPSEEYRKVFDVSVEKAKLWFFLEGKYNTCLGGTGTISDTVDQLYSMYATKEPTCATRKAAAELFRKHHRFLLLSMCGAASGCGANTAMWERTPLFRHYAREYPDELAEIQGFVAPAAAESGRCDTPASPALPPPARPRKLLPAQKGPKVAKRRKLLKKASKRASDIEEKINVRAPAIYGGSDSDDNSLQKRRSTKGKSSLRPSLTLAPPETPGRAGGNDSDTDEIPSALPLNRKRAPDDLVSFNIEAPAAKQPRTCVNRQFSISPPVSAAKATTAIRAPSSATSPQTVGPNRPGGHWECEIDGCKHSILDANEPKNLMLIEEHYEGHGRVVEQAMEAIGGESLPNRPGYRVK